MDKIKELIFALQILTGAAAGFRVVYLIFVHLHDEDHTMRNNKIKNAFIAAFLIEMCLGLGDLIKSYYM